MLAASEETRSAGLRDDLSVTVGALQKWGIAVSRQLRYRLLVHAVVEER